MSRLNQNNKIEYEYNINDFERTVKTVKNCPNKYDETERVLLIDGDSLLYTACYNPENKQNVNQEELTLEEVCHRLKEKIQEIVNNVEEWYNIKKTVIFVGGNNNFRYNLYSEYKNNRKKEKPEFFYEAKNYLIKELGAIAAPMGEADDMIYESYLLSGGNCLISCIDKDIYIYCPNVPFYNYRSYKDVLGEFKNGCSTKDSKYLIVEQIITGDSCDNVNLCKGVGSKYVKKHFHKEMSNFSYLKALFKAYLKAYKNDIKEAKNNLKLAYNLLRLYTQDEIKSLNL